jgi:ubiquinone/menaquinone biosynthesis C-methylase UbiE
MAGLQLGERVLDVACGTGLVTLPAARLVGPYGAVVGVDISQGMVEKAAVRAAAKGLGQVRFLRMEAESLELRDGSFDVALCSLGLMYVPDPVAALREIRRVLRPGGRLAVAVWGDRSRCGWAGIFPVVDRRVRSEVCPMFFQLGTGDNLWRVFAAAGFRSLSGEILHTILCYETAEAACAAAFAAGPVALAWSRFDEHTRREAAAEYLESIDRYRNGRGYEIPGEFVIVTGSKPALSAVHPDAGKADSPAEAAVC